MRSLTRRRAGSGQGAAPRLAVPRSLALRSLALRSWALRSLIPRSLTLSLAALSLAALTVAGCAGISPQPPPGDPRERTALEAFAIDPDAPRDALTALFAGDLDRFSEADLRELLDTLPDHEHVRVAGLVEGPTDQTFYVEVEEIADGEAVAGYRVELMAVLEPNGTTWRVRSLFGPGIGWPRRRRPRESLSVSPIEKP